MHWDHGLGDMTFIQGHDTSLGHGQQLCEILSMIQLGCEELWPGQGFGVCMRCDLEDMTLGQGLDSPLGHGQQLCEISRSNKAVKSYGLDKDFHYTDFCNVCTMTT